MCRLSGSLCVGWSLLALGAQLCSADWPSKASLPPLLIPMDAPAHGFQDIYHNPSSLAAFFSPFFYRTSSSRTWQGARDTVNPCVCVCLVMSLCNTMDYSPPCFSVHDISQPHDPRGSGNVGCGSGVQSGVEETGSLVLCGLGALPVGSSAPAAPAWAGGH